MSHHRPLGPDGLERRRVAPAVATLLITIGAAALIGRDIARTASHADGATELARIGLFVAAIGLLIGGNLIGPVAHLAHQPRRRGPLPPHTRTPEDASRPLGRRGS